MSRCSDCGHHHRTADDRIACAAIHGRIRGFPELESEPELMCELCRFIAPFSMLVTHFGHSHRGEQPRTGELVRRVHSHPTGGGVL